MSAQGNDGVKSTELTGRERLLRVLKGQKADRAPISPFIYYNAIYEHFGHRPNISEGYANFFDPKDFDPMEKYVEYCGHYQFDVIHPLGSVWGLYTLDTTWENWEVTVLETGDNDNRRREITIKTPEGQLRQSENIKRTSSYLVVSALDEYMIKRREDFELFRKYSPPADNLDCSLVVRALQATGEKGLICPAFHGAFNTLNMFRKLEDIMMDPYTDEGFYREMIDFFTAWTIERVVQMVKAGGDVVEMGANLAGSGVGAHFFETYVMPYEQRIIDAAHDAGAFLIYHNCGDAAKIMHLYNNMDMDVWGYLTPPPFGDVNLDEALRVIRPDMVLRGNIDQVEFLVKATPEQVRTRVRNLLLKVKPRGNFILSTTDFFFDGTPADNIRAFVEAGLEYGRY